MTLSFKEEKKKQKMLIMVVIVVIIITIVVLWFGVLKDKESPTKINIKPANLIKEINVDFNVLESGIFEEIKPFELISGVEGEKGRENPFLMY